MPLAESRFVRRSWPLLTALRAALRTEHNVRFALLFGSVAAGTDGPGSDVDVLVQLRDPSLEQVADLETKLAAVGRRVDVIRLEDAEADPAFFARVLGEGRVLVDRDETWPRLRRREASLRRRATKEQDERASAALAGIDRLLAS